eukprot:Opistho-2@26975
MATAPMRPTTDLLAVHRQLWPQLDLTETPLPTAWSPKDKYSLLELSHSSLRVHYKGQGKNDSDAAAVRANTHIPPACGVFYFEVKVVSKGRDGYIGIGLCSSGVSLNRLPGWEKGSYGYHGDDGHSFCSSSSGATYGPAYTTGDVIGCCVNFVESTCFYTKNGVNLGVAFRDLRGQLFPTVGLLTPGEVLEANFGQRPFEFDIEGYMQETRGRVRGMLSNVNLAEVPCQSGGTWESSITRLIASYLVHHGYSETALVFAGDTNDTIAESVASVRSRQRIREFVLGGDIDAVLRLIAELYPALATARPDLIFQLQCRRFVELVRESASASATPAVGDGSNPIERMMLYGQSLQEACDENPLLSSNRAVLEEAFSLLAYPDPSQSPMAYLLQPSQREPLATEINSAILELQGLPRQAPLEIIVRQAAVAVKELTRPPVGSGAAAFVSVEDILRE